MNSAASSEKVEAGRMIQHDVDSNEVTRALLTGICLQFSSCKKELESGSRDDEVMVVSTAMVSDKS